MKIKLVGRWMFVVPVPAVTATTCLLATYHFLPGLAWTFIIAGFGGASTLTVIAIVEHEKTRRKEIPFRTEHSLARAEARNQMRYVKAQTRRIGRISGNYNPGVSASLVIIIREIRLGLRNQLTLNEFKITFRDGASRTIKAKAPKVYGTWLLFEDDVGEVLRIPIAEVMAVGRACGDNQE